MSNGILGKIKSREQEYAKTQEFIKEFYINPKDRTLTPHDAGYSDILAYNEEFVQEVVFIKRGKTFKYEFTPNFRGLFYIIRGRIELTVYKNSTDDEHAHAVALNQGDAFRLNSLLKYKLDGALDSEIIITLVGA